MAESFSIHADGLEGLLDALEELPRVALEKSVVRRSLIQAAEPIRAEWSALAPYDASDLGLHERDSIVVSPKTVSRRDPAAPPGSVTVYVGPLASLPRHHAVFMEFGTYKDRPQPSGRPAFDSRKEESVGLLGYFMWVEIDGTAQRLAARAAKLS